MAEQMQHTPGPWRVVEKGRGWQESWREIWAGNLAVVRADGYYSSKYDDYEFGVAISEPNARRIVACVNACAGIPTELLQTSGVIPIRDAQKAVWELWNVVWQVLKDPDGSHTTHFASVSLIKERAIEIRDKLATDGRARVQNGGGVT